MRRLTVTGISHRTAPIELRERLAFSPREVNATLARLVQSGMFQECVILSTCNRVEIYGLSAGDGPVADADVIAFLAGHHGIATDAIDAHLYHYDHQDAIAHLFKVCCGLDSMVLGETQILAQTKQAFAVSLENETTGKYLNALFQRAFAVAKQAHTQTAISAAKLSVASVAVETAGDVFSEFSDKTLLLIGAGETGLLALTHFRERGVRKIIVTNRGYENARAAAERYQAAAVPMENLRDYLPQADIVVAAVNAEAYLVDPEWVRAAMKARRNHPVFMLDLSVPRALHPEIAELPNVFLYDVDDLQGAVSRNIEMRQREAELCMAMIEDQVQRFLSETERWSVEPVIGELHQRMESIRDAEMQRLWKRLEAAGQIDPRLREEIEQATRRMTGKLLHDPSVRLRAAAENGHGFQVVDVVRRLFLPDAPPAAGPPGDSDEAPRA